MASPTGGRFIIGTGTSQAVSLAINDGTNPISQSPVSGAFNIEVFTASTAVPPVTPATGFQDAIVDPGGTIVALGTGGALTGTNLTLGSGTYTVLDSATVAGRAAASVTLGSGTQRAVGAGGDTLRGGSGTQVLDGIQQFASGAETIIGGGGPTTVFGGPGDSVVAGTGNTYIDGTAGKMAIGVGGSGGADMIIGTSANNTISGAASGPDVITGGSAVVQIQSLGKGDVVNFANQTGNATINANTAANATNVGGVSATLGGGGATIFGGVGDTLTLGSVGQYADGGAGGMTITDGSGGTDNVFGSSVAGAPGVANDTFVGGAATLNFNPQTGGSGDLLNLSNSTGNATINAFRNGADVANINDTIMAGTGTDSVWGGQGDRIGVGTSSTAGGTHLFDHSTTISGAAVAFGTNDSVAGSSTAKVTVTNFARGTDSLFYQNELTATNSSIVASATATTPSDPAGSIITFPDGTQMTLIGVTTTQLGVLNSFNLLFKP